MPPENDLETEIWNGVFVSGWFYSINENIKENSFLTKWVTV